MQRSLVFLVAAFCCVGLVGCDDSHSGSGGSGGSGGGGGSGDLSFEDMCDQAASAICKTAIDCGSMQTKTECVAQIKAANCSGGLAQYCGVGMTFDSSKARTCLATIDTLACSTWNTIPTACMPEVLCVSQGGPTPVATPGEACHAVGNPDSCDAKASLCYAAGSVSSCPGKDLCLGDGTGMTCAARCTVDEDCLSAGTGLLCMQSCTMGIINGFCMTPKAKSKFMDRTCSDTKYTTSTGSSGWSL